MANMTWYNEPPVWSGDPHTKLTIELGAGTDFWRITHYDFIRDSGPFYYQSIEGDFEATVKVVGDYKELYHQAGICATVSLSAHTFRFLIGLMIRVDNKNWIKTGIEFVNGIQQVSAVVTREVSDWSVIPSASFPVGTPLLLKLTRKGDTVTVEYAFLVNNQNNNNSQTPFQMLRLAYFPIEPKVSYIGVMAAAPGKERLQVTFEDFKVSKLEQEKPSH